MSHLIHDPWIAAAERFPVGSSFVGLVRAITPYGAFVEITEGIDGLVHKSDPGLAADIAPAIGDHVLVRVLSFDPARSRLGLGVVGR
jgi:small subunit ribosomal protein S1